MKKMIVLLCLTIVIVVAPFFIEHGGEYAGADGEAEALIQQIAPDYEPWFEPFYEPPSGEIESLLFTLQGSLGAAVIFYILGYYRGRRSRNAND